MAEAKLTVDISDQVIAYIRDDVEPKIRALVAELQTAARAQLAEARRERDLAIAHDTQPYPTADAYERACAALHKHRERADAAEAQLDQAEARGWAAAVEALRDDQRYERWWTARGDYPPGGRYWETAPRNHLADYLEAVGPLPPVSDQTREHPGTGQPMQAVECPVDGSEHQLDGDLSDVLRTRIEGGA